jgi:hypothetical protein
MRPVAIWFVVATSMGVACERGGAEIGKDPAHAASTDPREPSPSATPSIAPSPSFSGRDPFKAPDDAGRD